MTRSDSPLGVLYEAWSRAGSVADREALRAAALGALRCREQQRVNRFVIESGYPPSLAPIVGVELSDDPADPQPTLRLP